MIFSRFLFLGFTGLVFLLFSFPVFSYQATAEKYNATAEKFIESGEYERAVVLLRKAVKSDYLYSDSYYNLARVYYKIGQEDKTLTNIEKALSYKPYEDKYREFQVDVLIAGADQLYKKGKVDKAIATYEEIIQKDDTNPKTYFALGNLYLQEKKWKEVIDLSISLENLIKKTGKKINQEKFEELRATKAIAFVKQDNYALAMKEAGSLRRSTSPEVQRILDPILSDKNPVILNLQNGKKYLEEKSYEQAKTCYETVLKYYPNHNEAKNFLKVIGSQGRIRDMESEAIKLQQKGNILEAIDLYRLIKTEFPTQDYKNQISKLENILQQKKIEEENKIKAEERAEFREEWFDKRYREGLAYNRSDRRKALGIFSELIKQKDIPQELEKKTKIEINKIEEYLRKKDQVENDYQKGISLYDKQNYQPALEIFSKLAKMSYKNAAEYKMNCLERLHLNDQLEETYRNLFKNTAKIEYLEKLAKLYEEQKSQDKVDKTYSEIIKLKPDNKLAKKYFEKIENQKKNENLKKNLIIAGGVIGVLILLIFIRAYIRALPEKRKTKYWEKARQYSISKNYKASLNFYEKLLLLMKQLNPRETRKIKSEMAKVFYDSGNYNQSMILAEGVVKEDVKNKAAILILARSYLKLGELSVEVLDFYKELLKVEPNNKELIDMIVQYYVINEIVEKDIEPLLKKAASKPDAPINVLKLYCKMLINSGEVNLSDVGIIKTVIDSGERSIEYFETILTYYSEKNDDSEIIKYCFEALQVDPQNWKISNLLGESCRRADRMDELKEFLAVLCEEHPDAANLVSLKENLDKRSERVKKGIFNESIMNPTSEVVVEENPIEEEIFEEEVEEEVEEEIEAPKEGSLFEKKKIKKSKDKVRGRLNLQDDEEDEKIRKQMEMFNQV